jgi:hypothetical protein
LLNRQPHCGREYLWIVVPERILNEGREADAKKARTLAEAGAVDLLKVAAWAEFFGGLRSGDVAPEIRAAIETALKAYAGALRSMATKPAEGAMTRQ